jgi:hypothetical protein
MMPQTGFVPELTNEAKARNIISRLVAAIGVPEGRGIVARLLASEGAITPVFVGKLDTLARKAEMRTAELGRAHMLIVWAENLDKPSDPQQMADEQAMKDEAEIDDRGEWHRAKKYGKGL